MGHHITKRIANQRSETLIPSSGWSLYRREWPMLLSSMTSDLKAPKTVIPVVPASKSAIARLIKRK